MDPFADFTKRLFKTYDANVQAIERFVIDLRFNEGGNGYLLKPFVQEFILRRDSLPRGKLYIITGSRTFSAATNLIGRILQQTNVITVGDIAPGPLNWCSDTIDFRLPNNDLIVNISTMFWMEGHLLEKVKYIKEVQLAKNKNPSFGCAGRARLFLTICSVGHPRRI